MIRRSTTTEAAASVARAASLVPRGRLRRITTRARPAPWAWRVCAWRPLLPALLVVLSGCDHESHPVGPPPAGAAAVASVEVSPGWTKMEVGDQMQVNATSRDANEAVLLGRAVLWSTSNASVATVSSGGEVTAISAGTASIIATSEGVQGSTVADVRESKVVARIVLSQGSVSVGQGARIEVTATAINESGDPLDTFITWTSSDPSVVDVDRAGQIQAFRDGTAILTATAQAASAMLDVEVQRTMSPFMKRYIEAIFLGSGPFVPRDNQSWCSLGGSWAAFPRGTIVEVLVSDTLGSTSKALVQAAAQTVQEATQGAITTTFARTAEVDPMPGTNQATAADHPDPQSTGCTFERGCVHLRFAQLASNNFIMLSSRTVLKQGIVPPRAYVHDVVGHGILGMCHIDQHLIGGNDKSLMAGGPGEDSRQIPDHLSRLDIVAARAVYGTDLLPGASTAEFRARGLVE